MGVVLEDCHTRRQVETEFDAIERDRHPRGLQILVQAMAARTEGTASVRNAAPVAKAFIELSNFLP